MDNKEVLTKLANFLKENNIEINIYYDEEIGIEINGKDIIEDCTTCINSDYLFNRIEYMKEENKND